MIAHYVLEDAGDHHEVSRTRLLVMFCFVVFGLSLVPATVVLFGETSGPIGRAAANRVPDVERSSQNRRGAKPL